MSEPKRYTFEAREVLDASGMVCFVGVSTLTHPMGKYVSYEDYARLKAEVERLTSENESLQAKATNIYNAMVVRCKVEEITHKANADSIISQGMMSEAMKMIEESVAIREQVERLTKAGDAMHCFLIGYIVENRLSSSYLNKLDDGWVNAREVKS